MSMSKYRTRKRYLEPDAWDEPLPRSTEHEIRKRLLVSPSVPRPRFNSGCPTTASSSAAADSSCGEEPGSDPSSEESGPSPVVADDEPGGHSSAEDSGSAPSDEDELHSSADTHPGTSSASSPFLLEFVTPLRDGSSMSVGDVLVLIIDIAIKHDLEWTAIENLLKFGNILLGRSVLLESKYLFRKFYGASPEDMKFHFYCPTCEHLLTKTGGKLQERNNVSSTCSICGKQYVGPQLMANGNFFVSLPLDKQFTSLLADSTLREQLFESLSRRKAPQDTGISDITDGSFYKQQREKLNCREHDLTLTMSADGSPMLKSSNYSIWPVHFTLNELPPHLRWRNIICSLLWYGTKHPNMTLLLQAFADQMRELSEDGISWNAGGQDLHSKVYCITSVADAPARTSMQNLVQFNGFYGCAWCLHPGVFVEGCIKYPVTVAVDDRTEASMLSDMTSAAAMNRTVNGVKGPSPLINVPGFDVVWSFRPDYMHCVLLGVVRQVTEIWFSGVGEDHYIGAPSTTAVVDQRLQSQRPHLCFNRPPRSIKLRKYWKASEWEAWLLYYCLPCLRDVLPEELLDHFALLVSGLYLLLQSHVTLEDVDTSTTKITKFVVLMQYYYGEAQMTSNVHTLLHLPKSVLLHGPLWSLSCFEFENNMGHLLKLVSSSNGIPFQILSRILLRNNFHQLRSMASEEVREQCSQKMPDRHTETRLLGKPQPASQDLTDFVREHLTGVDKIKEYHRVSVGGCTIHSEQYKAASKRDSTCIKLGDVCVKVENIVRVCKFGASSELFVVSHVYQVETMGDVNHMKVACKTAQKSLHPLCQAVRPCIHLRFDDTLIFAEL